MEIALQQIKQPRNCVFHLSIVEKILFFVYIFLSSFETYTLPFLGNITKYVMILIILAFIIKDLILRKFVISSYSIGLIAWLGLKCLSILVGGYNDIIPLHFISQIGFVVFVIPFMSHDLDRHSKNQLLLMFWLMSFLFGILSIVFRAPYLGKYTSRIVFTLFGQQDDPNNCAAIMSIGFAISLYCICYKKKYFIICSISAIVILIATILSGSRAGLLCIGLMIVVCFFFRKPITRFALCIRIPIFILVLLLAFLLAITVLPYNIYERFLAAFSDGGSERLTLWKKAMTLFLKHPLFGNGWGTATYYGKVFPRAVHNTFLSMLAENGIVSLCLFLAPFIYLCKESVKNKNALIILILISVVVSAFFIDSINKRFVWNGLLLSFVVLDKFKIPTVKKHICSNYLEITI